MDLVGARTLVATVEGGSMPRVHEGALRLEVPSVSGVASAISAGWSDLFDDEEMVCRFIQVVSRSLLQGMKEMLPGPDDPQAVHLRVPAGGTS